MFQSPFLDCLSMVGMVLVPGLPWKSITIEETTHSLSSLLDLICRESTKGEALIMLKILNNKF